jgi:hypothetical protein
MPPFRTLAAAAILTFCGGCSMAAEPSESPQPPAITVAAPCAESVATPTADRPTALAQTSSPWFGQGDLWVSLPDYPPTVQGETLMLRFPVVTLDGGVPTSERGAPVVAASRTDAQGEAPGQIGTFARAFGTDDLSFWPASVAFPDPGCWQVTGLMGAESVQFMVSVEEP